MLWSLVRSLVFLLPAETAHHLSMTGMKLMAAFIPMPKKVENNPIGLAAGFDKNCEVLHVLSKFGFGHAEIGTVTPRPQGGNPKPRLFRNPKEKTLFNRMGFNNLGAGMVSERLRRVKPLLPPGFIVGVNLGKNKTTSDEHAADDYAKVARAFLDTADYFVINVSSPNTPGLRALQTLEALTPIVKAVKAEINSAVPARGQIIPLFIKLAPELESEALQSLINGLFDNKSDAKIDGLVLTNTQAGSYIYRETTLTGGWSGQNLSTLSRKRLGEAKTALSSAPQAQLISVGGIGDVNEALERLKMGATRIQIYTGWIYQGPFFARRILRAIESAQG